jgi:TM2 domain-containing membrane protein YozV
MPTKPSSKKHGKAYLDEAVEKSTYRAKPITRKKAIIAGCLALPLGSTGIHNFLMRNKKRGFFHLLISSIAFGLFFFPFSHALLAVYSCQMGGECIDMSSYDDTLNALLITGLILLAGSIIWGAVEGIIILINHKHFEE